MPFKQQDFDGRLQLLCRDVALCCETSTDLDNRFDDACGVPVGHIEDQIIRERTKDREIVVLTRWHAIRACRKVFGVYPALSMRAA